MTIQKENALCRFMEQISEINDNLATLQDFVDNHMGYNPDDIDWGHVGTAGWVLERLTELTDFINNKHE